MHNAKDENQETKKQEMLHIILKLSDPFQLQDSTGSV